MAWPSLYSNTQKASVTEAACDNLTLLLSGGDLHLAQPIPDDARIDRVLFRPGRPGGKAVQIKTASTLYRGRYLQVRVRPPDMPRSQFRHFHVLGAPLLDHSPWIGPEFVLVPASALGPPSPSGWWHLAVPIGPHRRPSKWDRYRHPIGDLATVFSNTLDKGPAYPFPIPPATLRRLSAPATGRLFENEAACLITALSGGDLHLSRAFADDWGDDFTLTDESQAAALRLQPKGSLGLDLRGRVHAYIPTRTFRPRPYNLVLIMWYLVDELRLADACWLFRADELAKLHLTKRPDGLLEFMAPPTFTSKNRFRPWLYRVEEVPGVLRTALAYVRLEGAGAVAPTKRDEVAAARRRLRID